MRVIPPDGGAHLDRGVSRRLAVRVVIFGTGSGALRAWEALSNHPHIDVVAFLDNDARRQGTPFLGLPVLAPAQLDVRNVDAVLIGSMHADAILQQLEALGVPRIRIHTNIASLVSPPRLGARGRETAVGQGVRPTLVNFQVNDICNARCVMCNIWKRKRDTELSVAEFAALMSDPYFSEVEYVGITGGEPTLRRDLADFYLALPDVCPSLKGASFITHGLNTDRALLAYPHVAQTYRARGLDFGGMVSIDGVGAVHDVIRGRDGAFEQATRTLLALNEAGVPTIGACTVVRGNVWGLWDLLEWAQAHNVYVRFRAGEFIGRLYNDDATDQIRAFDEAETSAVISFFQALIHSYEPDESVRRTYASIISLVSGGERLVGCPYRNGLAVSVDCRGRFAVCAPKGTYHPLGSDATGAVRAADDERRAIIARHCASCIHDCHDEWLPVVAEAEAIGTLVKIRLARVEAAMPAASLAVQQHAPPRRVLVLGWYGTETIGDLAILAGLTTEYRRTHPDVAFVVPSEYPDYTRHNLKRIGLDCVVTSYGDLDAATDLWDCDTAIFGGGPLMDSSHLTVLAAIFERARALGCRTVVEGCGVGPVNHAETVAAIARIIGSAHEVRLRDAGSVRRLRELGIDVNATVIEDPAVGWVRGTGVRHLGRADGSICVFARALTSEYPQSTAPAEATTAVAGFLRRLCDWFPGQSIRLHAMHHFPVGGDDRVYGRQLRKLVDRSACTVDEVPRTPRETLDIMAQASFVVCMRFHSLVFAHTIGAPLMAIDYTDGGKVGSYLHEHGITRKGFSFADLDNLTREDLIELGVPGAGTR